MHGHQRLREIHAQGPPVAPAQARRIAERGQGPPAAEVTVAACIECRDAPRERGGSTVRERLESRGGNTPAHGHLIAQPPVACERGDRKHARHRGISPRLEIQQSERRVLAQRPHLRPTIGYGDPQFSRPGISQPGTGRRIAQGGRSVESHRGSGTGHAELHRARAGRVHAVRCDGIARESDQQQGDTSRLVQLPIVQVERHHVADATLRSAASIESMSTRRMRSNARLSAGRSEPNAVSRMGWNRAA